MIHPLIWLIFGMVCILAELFIPGYFLFCTGLSAIITSLLIISGLFQNHIYHFAIFISCSFFIFLAWHLLVKNKLRIVSRLMSDTPDLTGMTALVIAPIEPGKPGEVELTENYRGIRIWKAVSELPIAAGETVSVIEFKGIRLIVKPLRHADFEKIT